MSFNKLVIDAQIQMYVSKVHVSKNRVNTFIIAQIIFCFSWSASFSSLQFV